jgi:hypothetical protein
MANRKSAQTLTVIREAGSGAAEIAHLQIHLEEGVVVDVRIPSEDLKRALGGEAEVRCNAALRGGALHPSVDLRGYADFITIYGTDAQGCPFPPDVVASHLVRSSPDSAWLHQVLSEVVQRIDRRKKDAPSRGAPRADISQAPAILDRRLFQSGRRGPPLAPDTVALHLLLASPDADWLLQVRDEIQRLRAVPAAP